MEDINIDNHILTFVLESVNPINKNIYIEAYNTLSIDSNLLDLDEKLIYLMNKTESVDVSYIPIGINTIFLEVFRNVFSKLGVFVNWDISLRDSVALYDLLVEIKNHVNIVDILRVVSISDFDLYSITDKLDLEVINILEYIKDYTMFKESLYATYKEDILSGGVEV